MSHLTISRLVALVLNLIVAFTSGCASAGAVDATVQGVAISLSNRAGRCAVMPNEDAKRTVELLIPWPCGIHRGTDKNVRVRQQGKDTIFLVESSRPDATRAASCTTEVQAIRVRGTALIPSEYRDTVAKCPPFLWDDAMFVGLFSKAKP